MAGTLVITTLSDGTNSTSSTNCIQGSAKAWVNFVGSSGAVNASFNVSSVTRSSTGVFVVNLTTAMPTANYSAVLGAYYTSTGVTFGGWVSAMSTTAFTIQSVSGGGTLFDYTNIMATVNR